VGWSLSSLIARDGGLSSCYGTSQRSTSTTTFQNYAPTIGLDGSVTDRKTRPLPTTSKVSEQTTNSLPRHKRLANAIPAIIPSDFLSGNKTEVTLPYPPVPFFVDPPGMHIYVRSLECYIIGLFIARSLCVEVRRAGEFYKFGVSWAMPVGQI
jgi:hypothetical protein